MANYTEFDVAQAYKSYAEYLQREIDSFNRVDTLPTFGYRTELIARKKAAAILIPIQQAFEAAAAAHIEEAQGNR